MPIAHRTSVTVGLPHDGRGAGRLPGGLPSAEATARGWIAMAARASRLVLPDESVVESVAAGRCDLLLSRTTRPGRRSRRLPPRCGRARPHGRAVGDVDLLVPDVAAAVAAVARQDGWDVAAALDAAALILARAGERRALRDLGAIRVGIRDGSRPETDRAQIGGRAVAAVERRLVRRGVLLPEGIPAAWEGAEIEGHGLVCGPSSTLSFALRWHGEHPAVLWQVDGEPVELSAPAVDPSWRTADPSGEALWRRVSATGG